MKWLAEPDEHDYLAAVDYLSLLVSHRVAFATVGDLRAAEMTKRKAKDILRAARLDALPPANRHVSRDMKREALSPVLLVRTPLGLEIADGYHRVSAVYRLNEDADVHCKLTSLSG